MVCVKNVVCSATDLPLDRPDKRYRAQRRDLFPIPSPFWGDIDRLKSNVYGMSDATRTQRFRFRSGPGMFDQYRDRRLPIIMAINGSGLDGSSRRLEYESEKLQGWDDAQHLGEHMVCALVTSFSEVA